MKRFTSLATMSALVFATVGFVAPAQALDPAPKCESGKLKEAAKYSSCRLKAESKGVKKGEAPDYTKCESKFADKWAKTETKAGAGICPSEGDQVNMDARITSDAAEIAIQLSGVRYEDTDLGTVIDHQTGLEWQKTDDAGGLTDKDNLYRWSADLEGDYEKPDGNAFTVFLYGLNRGLAVSGSGPTTTGCYAGHCDWRIPVIEELKTIVDCSFGNPCIDQSVFGATNAFSFYWSSSSPVGTYTAWAMAFSWSDDGFVADKWEDFQVRAVRGGS